MDLTPEERKRIYEEEKERIEAEKNQKDDGESTTGLQQNVASLLCYVGFWISGIILFIIEQKNKNVRFHALQSIITFGALTVASLLLSWIPMVGGFFGAIIGIFIFILWIVLMVKAYQGELYKLPVAGDIAQSVLPAGWHTEKPGTGETSEKTGASTAAASTDKADEDHESPATAVSTRAGESARQTEDSIRSTRAIRIAGYSVTIFWNIVLLIFFSYFYQYIAWYHVQPDGNVIRLPFLTNTYFMWLPILVTALIISIAANIILIIYDRFWLRNIVQVILSIIGVVVVVNLLTIFPFDFSVIPNATAVYAVPVTLRIVLIIIAVGMGVGALVQFIKLIINIIRGSELAEK